MLTPCPWISHQVWSLLLAKLSLLKLPLISCTVDMLILYKLYRPFLFIFYGFKQLDVVLGEVTSIALENAIEQWVYDHTGASIEFDSAESISILEKVCKVCNYSKN